MKSNNDGAAMGSRPDNWPEPTMDEPEEDYILEILGTGKMFCTDGCEPIEDDGVCEHGHPSWALCFGLI